MTTHQNDQVENNNHEKSEHKEPQLRKDSKTVPDQIAQLAPKLQGILFEQGEEPSTEQLVSGISYLVGILQ